MAKKKLEISAQELLETEAERKARIADIVAARIDAHKIDADREAYGRAFPQRSYRNGGSSSGPRVYGGRSYVPRGTRSI